MGKSLRSIPFENASHAHMCGFELGVLAWWRRRLDIERPARGMFEYATAELVDGRMENDDRMADLLLQPFRKFLV